MRRDPRDVIASALKQDPSRTIFRMALTGRMAHQVVTEHEGDPRVSVIKYESLVRDPAQIMRAVCEFLEIPYDPVVVAPTVLGAEYTGNSRFDTDLVGISEAGVGRYRNVLSGPRLERAEALLAPTLAAGGYTSALQGPAGRHAISGAATTMIVRSGLWRSRALRAAFGGA